MRIVGLDVCKLSVVACILKQRPSEPRQFYYDGSFETFEANASGISGLLKLRTDIAVLEPTGVNYSKIVGDSFSPRGYRGSFSGSQTIEAYRKNILELPDKDDQADALALACYCFDYLNVARRFVQIRASNIVKIRVKL